MFSRRIFLSLTLGAAALAIAASPEKGWRDVLDVPAEVSSLAQRGLFNGLARAGERVVAVGQRGHVLWSDDAGGKWQQSQVPVSSDLVAVNFPTAVQGWAVGHDGVILHSTNQGADWSVQLEGRRLGSVLEGYYGRTDMGLSAEASTFWQAEAKRFADQGPENPFLDVWFDSEKVGYVVGAFGLMLHTQDGGNTWQPLMHQLDNPKGLHLYAVRRIDGVLHVAGEQGLLLKQNPKTGRFESVSLPYHGTLFGVMGGAGVVLVHGLRGTMLRSTDGGLNWQAIASGLQVGLTGNAMGQDGRYFVVSQAGHVLVSNDAGATFEQAPTEKPVPAAAVIETQPGQLVVAGPRGVQAVNVH